MISGNWRIMGDCVAGWAHDSELDSPLWVELWAGDESIGIARADQPEPQGCGFWLPIPPALWDSGEKLSLRPVNSLQEIPQASTLDENPELTLDDHDKKSPINSPLLGAIGIDRGMTISGWLADPLRLERKVHINAYVDGEKVAETVAGTRQYRPVEADGHGFSLTLPMNLADGRIHEVEIKDDTGRIAPGSPLRMLAMPENTSKWLKARKKTDDNLINALGDVLELMEDRLPGLIDQSKLQHWKKAFPVLPPTQRQKAALGVIGLPAQAIAAQQYGEFKLKGNNTDYYLIGDNTSRLHPFALGRMLEDLRNLDADAIYADSESVNGEAFFKTAWDRESFLAKDMLGPILVKAEALRKAGVSPNDPLAASRLKIMLNIPEDKIVHLPELLAANSSRLAQAEREDAARAWLKNAYPNSTYENGRINYHLREHPLISIIIPTRDHGKILDVCLKSLKKTAWPNYEIIIVDNGTVEEDALQVLTQAEQANNICVLRQPGIFNYAALNNKAVSIAKGELICFLNNDTEALDSQWLTEMARLLLMAGSDAGCVGSKLLWPNGLVQHGGVVVGCHQLAAHAGNEWLENEPGYMGRNLIAQRYSAVTAACLLTPRKLFMDSGGFDSRRFPIAFNDVDYCLRIGALGKKIFWTPHARLVHHESASRGQDLEPAAKARAAREMRLFRTMWGHYSDPFYNPNLPLSAASQPFAGLAFPPRSREPRSHFTIHTR